MTRVPGALLLLKTRDVARKCVTKRPRNGGTADVGAVERAGSPSLARGRTAQVAAIRSAAHTARLPLPTPLVRTRACHPGAGGGCRLRRGGEQGAGPAAHCAQRCAAPAAGEAWVEVGAAAAALQLTRCLGSAPLF